MKTPRQTPLAFEPGEKAVFLGIDEAAVRARVALAEIPLSCTLEGDGQSLCAQVRDTAVREELKSLSCVFPGDAVTVQALVEALEPLGFSCELRQDILEENRLIRLRFQKMQSIVIRMDSRKMDNPDLDIRYTLPDRIEEWSQGAVQDNGYDYVDEEGHILAVWLKTEDAEGWWPKILELLKTEKFEDNDLSQSAQILVSEKPNAELDQCRQVWPE